MLNEDAGGERYDILLIQPRVRGIIEVDDHPSNPPLGLGYLAAVLEHRFKVGIADLNTSNLPFERDMNEIIKSKPEIIGISVNTPALPFVYHMIHELRKGGFMGSIILGGPHITARPEALRYFNGVVGLRGEGEVQIEEVCSYLMGNEKIPKSCLWSMGSVFVENLETLPLPARHLFRPNRYKFMHVMCSRGCPYDCTYCSMAKTKYRRRSPYGVVDEMLSIASRYPQALLGFGDDVFTLDPDFVEEICNGIKRRGLRVRWSCTTRADLVDRRLLEVMHKTGCWHVSFGVETGVEDIRYNLNKRIENERYL